MSDLFHHNLPLGFIKRAFETMRKAHWHTFQILAKRFARPKELAPSLLWPPNVWIGVELPRYYFRMADLQALPSSIRFLSCEPLLGDLPDLPLNGIHWVIVGGELGPSTRPMKAKWVEKVCAQCVRAGLPFFFEKWGGVQKWRHERLLKGCEYNEFPTPMSGMLGNLMSQRR